MRRSVAAVSLAAAFGVVVPAYGASPTAEEKGQAEALFRDGRALMNVGNFAEACAKFEESQRLDPQLGTQLNMALCHASAGRTASAWAEFREVAELSEKEHDRERAHFARQQATHLEKKLARVVLRVVGPPEGIVVRLDGQAIGASAWTTALPVNPGEHAVEASAPGKKSYRSTAHAVAATTVEIPIPTLEEAPAEPPPVVPAPQPPPARVEAPPPAAEPSSPPVPGYVLGGVGVAAIAVGAVFGFEALAKKRDADRNCSDTCSPEGHTFETQARTDAIVSTIAIGVGIAGLAAGTYLVLTSKRSASRAAVWVNPTPFGLRVRF